MKLVSAIKPKNVDVRNVDYFGSRYVFKRDKNGEFVSEVPDKDAKGLIETGHFYPAGAKLQRNPPPLPNDQDEDEDDDSLGLASFAQEVRDEAESLISGTAEEIKGLLRAVSSIEVVKCAHALEQTKDSPRKGVSDHLATVIEHAKVAGQG